MLASCFSTSTGMVSSAGAYPSFAGTLTVTSSTLASSGVTGILNLPSSPVVPFTTLSPTFTLTGTPANGLPSSSVTLPVTLVGLPTSISSIGSTVRLVVASSMIATTV